MNLGIAGIHTDIGKTVCSTIIVEALGYDYWKPVQAGSLDETDGMRVQNLISNSRSMVFPERYKLNLAASPHFAAEKESVEINIDDFSLPESANGLVVETAGGLMSPLAKNLFNIDLLKHLKLNVLFVSNNYLGSINHTLLSYQVLKNAGYDKIGLIFCGEPSPHMSSFIIEHTECPVVLEIPKLQLTKESIAEFAEKHKNQLKDNLYELFGEG